MLEPSALRLALGQTDWELPLYEARRIYTTTIHNPTSHAMADVLIEFEGEGDGDWSFPEPKAQRDDQDEEKSHPVLGHSPLDGLGPSASSTPIEKQPLRDEPLRELVFPDDDLLPGVQPDAVEADHENTTTVMQNEAPLITEEAIKIAIRRREWRSFVAPELSPGPQGEWKRKFSVRSGLR